jgi:alkanesulfonate monooxygenase SsuD/methylene tetrahydromethanopterin reductase-like flavin-dependent oxidoreductase (luciferase family)
MKFAYMPDTHFGVYDQDPPTPVESAEAFVQLMREAELAEAVGLDAIFLPERHARAGTFVPSPLVAATAIAARTSRTKIATTVRLPTPYDPMHLAEQTAMIDILSHGRFTYGAGVGHHPLYHQSFGVPWGRRGRCFEEAM